MVMALMLILETKVTVELLVMIRRKGIVLGSQAANGVSGVAAGGPASGPTHGAKTIETGINPGGLGLLAHGMSMTVAGTTQSIGVRLQRGLDQLMVVLMEPSRIPLRINGDDTCLQEIHGPLEMEFFPKDGRRLPRPKARA